MRLVTGRFRRADRILLSRDFRRVARSGKRRTSESFVIAVASRTQAAVGETDLRPVRLGVAVGKRVGSSVVRNRVKRCIREWFRRARERLPGGLDFVVIARCKAKDLSSSEVTEALNEMVWGGRARAGSRATAEFR